jgi:hypothetical protein
MILSMKRIYAVFCAFGLLLTFCGSAMAQSVISAKSGLIHYVEGRVLLDGKPVEVKIATFPDMKDNSELRTEDGRAEILLTPGAFLRVGENSAVRMLSTKLADSRIEFLSGSAVIEADGGTGDGEDFVTVNYQGAAVHIRKGGIYRFDSEPAQLRVYSGQAEVETGVNTLIVKAGKMAVLPNAVAVEKFDSKNGDALNRWSQRRAEYISMANVSAAKFVRDSGTVWNQSNWYYNPYFGMMTYIPYGGIYRSPYGYVFYTPRTVQRVYEAPVTYAPIQNSGRDMGQYGYRSAPQTSSGYSGVVASAPTQSTRSESPAQSSGPASGAGAVSRESSGGARSR